MIAGEFFIPYVAHILFLVNVLTEKAMAPHSSTLAWKIPWVEEPGRLQPMGSLRVGHNWVTSLSVFIFMHWRRKWQPTPLFLPGESQGRGSLVSCCLWGGTESDTTEVTYQHQQNILKHQHLTFDLFNANSYQISNICLGPFFRSLV